MFRALSDPAQPSSAGPLSALVQGHPEVSANALRIADLLSQLERTSADLKRAKKASQKASSKSRPRASRSPRARKPTSPRPTVAKAARSPTSVRAPASAAWSAPEIETALKQFAPAGKQTRSGRAKAPKPGRAGVRASFVALDVPTHPLLQQTSQVRVGEIDADPFAQMASSTHAPDELGDGLEGFSFESDECFFPQDAGAIAPAPAFDWGCVPAAATCEVPDIADHFLLLQHI